MKDNQNKTDYNSHEISDSDIYQAMIEISGYIDITPEDFKEVYSHAYQHAHRKLSVMETEGKPKAAFPITSGTTIEKTVPAAFPISHRNPFVALKNYLEKMKGTDQSPPMVGIMEICWSWIGAFLGIAAVAYCNFNILSQTDVIMIIGSFGASAVLIYGAIKSPLAQPRNLIGGHMLSAIIGVASYQYFSFNLWLASAITVATAIAVMHATKTLHPPGGATALIAVIGSQKIHDLGYLYALAPAGLGAGIMLIVALVVNNIPRSRKYPEFWL
jgi:CBS-domain-containing membrane protein